MKSIINRCVLGMFIAVVSFQSGQAQDNLMDVLPPDIHPVVILQGTDYEMGYQYGQ